MNIGMLTQYFDYFVSCRRDLHALYFTYVSANRLQRLKYAIKQTIQSNPSGTIQMELEAGFFSITNLAARSNARHFDVTGDIATIATVD